MGPFQKVGKTQLFPQVKSYVGEKKKSTFPDFLHFSPDKEKEMIVISAPKKIPETTFKTSLHDTSNLIFFLWGNYRNQMFYHKQKHKK